MNIFQIMKKEIGKMSKGDIAKAGVIEKIAAAFGSDYIGENSKK